ncbi:YqgE/AlgH family protein [Bacteroides fluxus]|jgi:putative transcriptional regulator|uniref:YqgE/AlgH family protein n=1 Tax=Bacteroides fluxus TaxID=626930 RepID=UPI002A841DBB|nr:YqgE/AlgH family protein [Bacteroides fluxus]MDY3790445.1 YqgE/AlgH family protein [Bacteroides fluxus]
MYSNTDIFKIETNHIVPAQGKILISEPFLCDHIFGRSVILLVDHTKEGTMGLVLNKPLPLFLNDILQDFNYQENIPIYKGGPLSTDTLFYLHTLEGITDSLPISNGLYLNGDFNAIKEYILQGNPIKGKIRFFLGYSGWEYEQLHRELEENTWLVSTESKDTIMDENAGTELWKNSLGRLGSKYELWSRFPQIPALN